MINRYKEAARTLIESKQQVPLHMIVNRNNEPASWDDHHWTLSELNGVTTSIPLHNIVTAGNLRSRTVPVHGQYSDTERHLLMAYILDLRIKRGSKSALLDKIVAARHLIARINLFSFSQQTINDLHDKYEGKEWLTRYMPFITWLQGYNVVADTIKVHSIPNKNSGYGDDAKAKSEKRMPDERALWAMGAIRNKIIPSKVPKGVFQRSLRDEFIISSATLALGSPQRLAKEQFVLSKSTLQSKMVSLDGKKDSKKQKVHWMDWKGSKGFQANRKHFFRGAAIPVSQVLNYWNEVGEPARILCRFFEKPCLELKDLLGDYTPSNLEEFDVSKPIDNMFVLGYLLGFYDGQKEQTVTLTPGEKYASDKPTKQIQDITLADKVNLFAESKVLFGSQFQRVNMDEKIGNIFSGIHTVAQLQDKWITYIKENVPTFPYRIIGANKVALSHALFIGTGAQMTVHMGGYAMSHSYYAIESTELSNTLSAGLRHQRDSTIYERHGFASDISLTPNQLRHWSNTMMQKSLDISDSVIAIVSGRKDIKQNTEYDHETDEQKVAKVRNLFRAEQTVEEMKKEVRVVGHQKYQEATGKASTLTATGICTQQITVNPCTYLNDFESHCALCTSSCHFAHDEKAIQLLEDDLRVQQHRLQDLKGDEYIFTNTIKQAWFKRHHRNTFLLEQLISLMKREDLKIGTAIKFVNNSNSFRLTNLDKRLVEEVKVLLPDSEQALQQLIEAKQTQQKAATHDENKLTELFAEFGLQGEL